MAQAGYAKGFSIKLTTEKTGEIPQLAQIFQSCGEGDRDQHVARDPDVDRVLRGHPDGPPTGYGNTPWLNAPVSITDWGHRAVPNVLPDVGGRERRRLERGAVQEQDARRCDQEVPRGDRRSRIRGSTRARSRRSLLRDTPIIFPYFYNYIAAGSKTVKGYQADALGQVYLSHTSLA